MPKPDFFIVGAPKSGTTALYHYLKTHPQIFLPEIKEPCYFASDIEGDYGQVKTLREYKALYQSVENQAEILAGDASPIYLMSEVAIDEILKFNPDARFIAVIRNPVDMVQSVHNQALKVPEEDVEDFEKAWFLQESRSRGENMPTVNKRPINLQYKRFCSVGSQLQALVQKVPEDQCLILMQEDMKKDPFGAYKKVLGFLELPYDGRIDFPIYNEKADLRSRRLQAFMKEPPVFLRAFRKIFHLLGLRPLKWAAKMNRKEANKSVLSPDFSLLLVKEFEDEIKKVETIMKKDLSHWRRIS